MTDATHLAAIHAMDAPPRRVASNYPEPFASRMGRREVRALGDLFGLERYGVNLTRLAPGAQSALRHAHSAQDECVYILQGTPTLIDDRGETVLAAGMFAGFKAGTGNAHHLVNRSDHDVLYLEIGERGRSDEVAYPDDDLMFGATPDGRRYAAHKNGSPYA